jgi:hypothetical protein
MNDLRLKKPFAPNLKLLLIAAAILLLLGIPVWLIDYYGYILLRLIVCLISAYCAYRFKPTNRWSFWIMIIIAFALNPIVLVGLIRKAFFPIDLVIGVYFLWLTRHVKASENNLMPGNDPQLRSILIAGCVSLAIGVSMIPAYRIRFGDGEITAYDWIISGITAPISLAMESLGLKNNLTFMIWGSLLGTMLFYGSLAWLAISAWTWARTNKLR